MQLHLAAYLSGLATFWAAFELLDPSVAVCVLAWALGNNSWVVLMFVVRVKQRRYTVHFIWVLWREELSEYHRAHTIADYD